MKIRQSMPTILLAWLMSGWCIAQEPVAVRWLDGAAPALNSGVSWGVPWAQGTTHKDQTFSLSTGAGKALPVQTWPLAYWPDGSLKWSGFATVADANASGPLQLSPTASADEGDTEIRVTQSDTTLLIDTGRLRARIRTWGGPLIDSLTVDNREVARNGRLVCILQEGPDGEAWETPSREKYVSTVETVTIEQSGPVQAVVKVEGKHRGVQSAREWLPFVVRFYFYAGSSQIRLVHTIVYDGDQFKDFIRGLGLVFDVPMREEIQNRHVRFSGQGQGLWSEPIQPMIGRGGRYVAQPRGESDAAPTAPGRFGRFRRPDVYPDQVAGRRVPNKAEIDERGRSLLADWAIWDDFKLVQPNADGFTVVKRTNPESVWLPAGAGRRASGLVFAGDVSGGLAASLRNFWQSYPASLEVRNAAQAEASLYVWFWSPDGPAMDMRHYDTKPHGLEAVYEDVQPGFSEAHGVARTSEVTLFALPGVPTKEETSQMARLGSEPPVLVCTPQYLNSVRALGYWGVEDRSTPFKAAVEERLDAVIETYLKAVDQHNWYGFWDYGDVMHSYDPERHVWRYDLGGMAWDNSELGTDMWLWMSFLHTGRADIFRMAEAMTRHTGEVDCYHLGKFAGLGSRHNVRHWGCGAKEVRISQAGYRRYHYYLTTDERTGDVMREMIQADHRIAEVDPMRLAQPITEAEKRYPARLRLGPDWFALAGNWWTEWERTGDTQWRDKIYRGFDSLCAMPLGLRSGRNLVMGFDPDTGQLYQLDDNAGVYNLATIMGAAEVILELNMMVDHQEWHEAWLRYCRLYSAPKEMLLTDMETGSEGMDAAYVRDGRLAAYLYLKTGQDAFLQRAVRDLARLTRPQRGGLEPRRIEGPEALNPLDEGPGMNTNSAAQNGLTALAILGMVGEHLPEEIPAFDSTRERRGRGRGN